MSRFLRIEALALALAVVAIGVSCEETPEPRSASRALRLGDETLARVKEVAVMTEETDSELSALGVTEAGITRQVEAQLRARGITVAGTVDSATMPGYLHVSVTVVDLTQVAVFTVVCEYIQDVLLARKRSIRGYLVPTWSAGRTLVAVRRAGLVAGIDATIGKSVADFANAYLAANPTRR